MDRPERSSWLKIEISLNHISLATDQYIIYSCARIQDPRALFLFQSKFAEVPECSGMYSYMMTSLWHNIDVTCRLCHMSSNTTNEQAKHDSLGKIGISNPGYIYRHSYLLCKKMFSATFLQLTSPKCVLWQTMKTQMKFCIF